MERCGRCKASFFAPEVLLRPCRDCSKKGVPRFCPSCVDHTGRCLRCSRAVLKNELATRQRTLF